MELIIHRINLINKLKEIPENFGVEIDIRSYKSDLVLNHEPYFNGDKSNLIAGYGASATSTTLISYFKISKFFKYLIDDNPAKIGLYSPGYHLPVFEEKIFKSNPPDAVIILAWRYKDNILKKLKLLKKKYKLKKLLAIVPLPDIKFYNL